jgi:hypothetical protein
MNSKLIKDLPDLVTNDVISQDIASKIEQYYLAKLLIGYLRYLVF